jgi:hypothetical protein
MKPIHVGLLVAAAALGGAFFMKIANRSEPAPQPAVTASTPADPMAAAPDSAAQPPAAVDQTPAEQAKPSPFDRSEAAPRKAPRSLPVETAQNRTPTAQPPAAPAPAVTQPPAPAAQTPPAVSQTTPPPPSRQDPIGEPKVFKPLEPPGVPPPRQVTIPAGTTIPVRIVETLVSNRVSEGDTFSATLDAPLTVDGLVIAERGARAQGRIVRTEQAGRVKGLAALGIELTSVRTSDGQTVKLQTDTFERQGEKEVGKDAAKVGVAAGIGAAIGAIAGGGKGAGIGAAVGGAAGTGGVLATRGKPVTIPSETKIGFRLRQPVTVTEKK